MQVGSSGINVPSEMRPARTRYTVTPDAIGSHGKPAGPTTAPVGSKRECQEEPHAVRASISEGFHERQFQVASDEQYSTQVSPSP
jgi:hypothetical protein